MHRRSARTLLITKTMRQRLEAMPYLVMLMVSSISCILPPEGEPDLTLNVPPLIDLRSLSPEESRINVDYRCDVIRFRASVSDLDDQVLAFRWVANNNLPGSRCLEGADRLLELGSPQTVQVRITPGDFTLESERARSDDTAGVLSLFVTDAAVRGRFAWEEPNCDPTLNELPKDFGQLSDEAGSKTVVEVRWTLNLTNNAGECPR